MIETWSKNAHCDGVREMYEARKSPCKFIYWAISMIVMALGTGYFIVRVVKTYNVSPTTTTYSIAPMIPLAIPQILLCYNGGLNGAAMVEANLSKNLMLSLSGALTLGTMDASTMNNSKQELDKFLIENNLDITQLYQKFAYNCEDLVEIVYPAGADRMADNIACKNLIRHLSPFYGVCLLYSNNGLQNRPGLASGVRLYLKSPADSFASIYPDLALKADRSHSFLISIQEGFYIPSERYYLIPMNMKTEISLDTKHYIRLPESNSSCSDKYIYSSDTCFNRCFGDTFYRFCGCYPFRYYSPEVDKLKQVCNIFEEQSCRLFDPSVNKICEKDCIPICDEWLYDIRINYAPTATKSNVASVWIGYDSMHFTKIEDVYTYTIETAIANVGYQANLWLGLSLVTIVQCIYYVILSIRQTKCSRKQNHRQPSEFEPHEVL